MAYYILILLSCVLFCSTQIPDIPVPPLQCLDLDPSDSIDHLRCYSGQITRSTVVRTVNDSLENVLLANKPRWDPRIAISVSNLNGGGTLKNFDYYLYAGEIDNNGASLYPDIEVMGGETLFLVFHKDSHGQDAVKGVFAFDLDGTFVKLVVAFDVDGNRQEQSILKYNVELRSKYDRLGHRLWYSMVSLDGWDAKVEDASEFNEKVDSGVVMQASMTDSTKNKYMIRIDSKDFS